MVAAPEPTHHLMHDTDDERPPQPPPSPRVTPEPAPSDTVLIAAGVASGVVGTLLSLAVWRIWRRRGG